MRNYILIGVVLLVLSMPNKIFPAFHSVDIDLFSDNSDLEFSGLSLSDDEEESWSCDVAEMDCLTEQYSHYYSLLKTAALNNFSINGIVDQFVKKIRRELVLYNRTEFLLPTLDIVVPDAAFELRGIFTNVRMSGGEAVYRRGNATAALKDNGELLLDVPMQMLGGNASGALRIGLAGFTIDAPFSGVMTARATYEFGMTLFPLLPSPRLPQITKLRMTDVGYINIDLEDWRTTIAIILTVSILFIIFAVLIICFIILTIYLVYRMRRMSKELKAYKKENNAK